MKIICNQFISKVESRTDYLEYLIKSFEDVKGIADVLLIFSHAVYDANVNELVQSIRYCRVMQVKCWIYHDYVAFSIKFLFLYRYFIHIPFKHIHVHFREMMDMTAHQPISPKKSTKYLYFK